MKHSTKMFFLLCCVLPLCFAGCKPIVTITAPANGYTFAAGETITFEGQATDIQHPDLADDAFVWTSDKEGKIGTGQLFTSAELSEGKHTIILTVTDDLPPNYVPQLKLDVSCFHLCHSRRIQSNYAWFTAFETTASGAGGR